MSKVPCHVESPTLRPKCLSSASWRICMALGVAKFPNDVWQLSAQPASLPSLLNLS